MKSKEHLPHWKTLFLYTTAALSKYGYKAAGKTIKYACPSRAKVKRTFENIKISESQNETNTGHKVNKPTKLNRLLMP